jgi:GntR family transcriptional regulator/MocR family aminotransferase
MDPIFDLAIDLPPRGSRNILQALHRQLRAAILDGRLKPDLRLPATRALADALGVSRNTAVATYDLLLSEGYLVARPGSGTYVADMLPRQRAPVPAAPAEGDARLSPFWRMPPAIIRMDGPAVRDDFRVGLSDKGPFPFEIWRRLSARALRGLSKMPAAYAPAEGRPELRDAIARHISFARAVAAQGDDVIVTSGAQQAFDLLARVLVTPGMVVAVEEPGYPPLRNAFAAAGARVIGVAVDAEGLIVDDVPADARIVCVTPSHQFPLGPAMSPQRRAALLDFARGSGAVIVEDDYDGEFRFSGRPLEALQTLDRGDCVFYVGTFSKSLFPALRLGFVVTPAWARTALVAAKQHADWHGPVLAQDTLAAFIDEGHLARHVRKMRKLYGERRRQLIAAMAVHCGGWLQPIAGAAGLHLAARLDPAIDAGMMVERALAAGIRTQSLARYATRPGAPNGLTFGFGMIATERIEPAIRRLAGVRP